MMNDNFTNWVGLSTSLSDANDRRQHMTPRTFSHIGISVPDLDAAVKFYSEIMGFYVLMQPSEVTEDEYDAVKTDVKALKPLSM